MLVKLDVAADGKFAEERTRENGAEITDVHGHYSQHAIWEKQSQRHEKHTVTPEGERGTHTAGMRHR